MYDKPKKSEEWAEYSILNPEEFDRFFKEGFISIAGFVAELLYRRRPIIKVPKQISANGPIPLLINYLKD